MSWKAHFSRVLSAVPERLHVASHSHHPWPDVSFTAQQRCWDDAARLLDTKWEHVLGTVKPAAQAHVARHLGLSDPASVTFSPNTHDFLCRLLSCWPAYEPVRVLTSDSEFYSFTRQIARLEEDGLAQVTRVPAQPFDSFGARFAAAARTGGHHLVYLSQTFFNAGYRLDMPVLEAIAAAIPDPESFFVIDGYHSFLADPVDFGPLEARAFFLSGGYKYAMAGEGVVFLHAPPGYGPRPRQTGWYAAFGTLADAPSGAVPYARDAARFDGATFDPSGLYRFGAIMDWLAREGLTVAAMACYVRDLQRAFIAELPAQGPVSRASLLLDPDHAPCGRFLTFVTPEAGRLQQALMDAQVITDSRGDHLRFGFGIYHDTDDMTRLLARLARLRLA